MSALNLWLRRGYAARASFLLCGFMAASVATSHYAVQDPEWGARALAVGMFFFSPILAGATAFDVGRRAGSSFEPAGLFTIRGPLNAPLIASAGVAASMVVHLLAWIALVAVARANAGLPFADFLIGPETLAALAASAAVGLLVGGLRSDLMGPVIATAAVLLTQMLTRSWELTVFQVASSAGTLLGIERTPTRALLAIGINMSVALSCVLALWAARSPIVAHRRFWIAASVVPIVSILLLRPALLPTDSEYRPETGPTVCIGQAPTVCGPQSASGLLAVARADLDKAIRHLADSQLPFPQRYAIARGESINSLPPNTAELALDPSILEQGHLSQQTLTDTLSLPRFCEAMTNAEQAQPLLAHLEQVHTWLATQMRAERPEPAPETVKAAYSALLDCRP